MNHRDRALAAMRGEKVDRIPFLARMDLWYGFHRSRGTLPHPYEKADHWDIHRDLGIGIVGSWVDWGDMDSSFFRLVHHGVEISKEPGSGSTTTTWSTPHGTLTCRDEVASELGGAAGTGIRTEYPFKSTEDYDAIQFFIEHTEVVENYAAYGEFIDSIGTDGLALPFSGYLPAHQVMQHFMGYETFYYELHDHPSRLERLIEAITEQQWQVLGLAAGSPAQIIEVGGNYDEQLTPPPIFDRFFARFYQEARQALDSHGKILVVHGDSEMIGLLKSLRDCGVQVVESLTLKPMTSIDVAETRGLWKDRVAMWGGIPCVMLTPDYSDEEYIECLDRLFQAVAPGDRFILGFGDNVPTNGLLSRIVMTAQYWAEHGQYPLPRSTDG